MLTPKQCRAFDQYLIQQQGVPGAILMENAGRGCAERLLQQHRSAGNEPLRVSVLCGPGNNGGDGFVIARHLLNADAQVTVVLFAEPQRYSGDAKIMLDCLAPLQPNITHLDEKQSAAQAETVIGTINNQPCHWCVDALLGTGVQGPLYSNIAQAITIANRLPLKRFAVDVPTGLDPFSGQPGESVFKADFCGTFVATKSGFENPAAKNYLGEVAVIAIGFTPNNCGWQPPAANDIRFRNTNFH